MDLTCLKCYIFYKRCPEESDDTLNLFTGMIIAKRGKKK